MEPKPTYTTGHPVIFHDATPAMADVISGSTHRPEPPATGENLIEWALRSHAGQRALSYIGAAPHAPITLLAAPGEIVTDGAVYLARDAYAEPLALVLALRHNGAMWLVALNEDGTGACTIDVAGLAATGSEIAAAILEDDAGDDLPPELDYDQLAEIARAWPWNVRDALARFVAHAMTDAGITDRRQRIAVIERLAVLCGDINE